MIDIAADRAAGQNLCAGQDRGVIADLAIVAHRGVRVNVDVLAEAGASG